LGKLALAGVPPDEVGRFRGAVWGIIVLGGSQSVAARPCLTGFVSVLAIRSWALGTLLSGTRGRGSADNSTAPPLASPVGGFELVEVVSRLACVPSLKNISFSCKTLSLAIQ